jgi:hypothetical protein
LSAVTGAIRVTPVAVQFAVFAKTVISDEQVMVGGWLSVTVTVC